MNVRLTLLVALLLVPLAACAEDKKDRKTYTKPPEMKIDPNKQYTATIDTTAGKIVCELYAKDAPLTVNNFVFLAKEGFYDGLTFHRVIKDFMIQGGDPEGSGSGGPGYKFADETKNTPHKFQRGSLAMANAGPDTNGSQFFITHVVTDWLDGKHTIFGQVKSGQDVVDKIKQGDEIKSIKIEEK
jgi:peptidyl-prolyl cis-trans isomerase B (cyclophilin B)